MNIQFPAYSGLRCLMMPYVQGDPTSVPESYASYGAIVRDVVIQRGAVGYLTIDESPVKAGVPHRGARAKFSRALHTEAGRAPGKVYRWGGGGWARGEFVELERGVKILLVSGRAPQV